MTVRKHLTLWCDGPCEGRWFDGIEVYDADTAANLRRAATRVGWIRYGRAGVAYDLCPRCAKDPHLATTP